MKRLFFVFIALLACSVSFGQRYYNKTESDAKYPLKADVETSLGNPTVNGYVLSSTTSGVRTWIANGSGGSMVYPAGSGIPIVLSGSSWTTTITDNHLNWDKYNQWDGGSTGLTAATGRTSLGGTTAGQAIFTVANPSAITFLQVNANNTASLLSASAFRTAIGAGTGSGDMLLGTAQSVTETKTFTKDKLLVKGTSTGTTNITTANTSATSYVATIPAKTGTIAMTSDIISQVEDNITDAHTTIAPSGNAVFDALALKLNTADLQDPVPIIYSTVATAQINAQTASYAAVLGDLGKTITITSASATTFTMPLYSAVAFPLGATINVLRLGTGDVTIAITATGTLQSENSWVKIGAQYSGVTLLKLATNTWIILGRLKA